MKGPLPQRRDALLAELSNLTDDLRWDWMIERARGMKPLSEEERIEPNRLSGCVSNLWLVPSFDGAHCHFRCDADSVVVKAVAGLLCDFYSDATPADILALDPSFLREAGITEHLTSHRRNALTHIWAQIRGFAARHAA